MDARDSYHSALLARVARRPAFAGDFVVWLVRKLPAAAGDALPALGLRAVGTGQESIHSPQGSTLRAGPDESLVTGPAFAARDASVRQGPAQDVARALWQSLQNASILNFMISGRRILTIDRPLVMTAINRTPDSFSDGGIFTEIDAAANAALDAARDGAAIVDIGGESTRPGAAEVPVDAEISRVVPVITKIRAAAPDLYLSVDTRKAAVAAAALEAGADMVNDVSGLTDPSMAAVVAQHSAAVVIGHMRGTPATMQQFTHYNNLRHEVLAELLHSVDRAVGAGVPVSRILIDPGLGFAKTAAHNWDLLQHLAELRSAGFPIVAGASRKSFLGAILDSRAAADRDDASLAAATLAAAAGASILRVHKTRATTDALRVVQSWNRSG